MKIRKGDTVYLRSGADKGKTGKVLRVNKKNDTVVIEGRNMMKKHQRPTQKQPKGGIVTLESPIHISNVALYSSTLSGPTKISVKVLNEGGKKKRIRVSRETGEEI